MSNSNDAYNYHIQSKYLLNMAYLRVKNITVGYTLLQILPARLI